MGKETQKSKKGYGDRLRQRREKLKMLQKDVGDALGISAASIGQWEREDTAPGGENLLALAEVLQVEPAWIINGQRTRPILNAARTKHAIMELPLISALDIGKGFSRKTLTSKQMGTELTALEVSHSAFAMGAVGDSMINPLGYPSMPPGTIVIVDPELEERNGDYIVVVSEDGDSMMKKLVKDGPNAWLVSLNPEYPRIDFSPKMKVIGVVVGLTSRLREP